MVWPVRDDVVRRRLSEANPWWNIATTTGSAPDWATHDGLLIDRRRWDVGYRSPLLDDVATGPLSDSLVLVQGPRRVGKSVLLRDLAQTLCGRNDIDPRQIINLACDGMTAQDLTRAIKLGRELTRSVDQPTPHRRVWLLDEVSPIQGWTSALKHARDNSLFGADTVIATGSSWRQDEDLEGNLFAGRAGTSNSRRLRQMFPLSFPEYLAVARPDLPRLGPVHPANLKSPEMVAILEPLRFLLDDFDLAWQAFLSSGGFPRSVHSVTTTGRHDISYLEDLHAWLRRDVDPDGPPESIPLLLGTLATRATSPLDRAGTASDLGYASKSTFERRLSRLVNSFAAIWCPQRDTQGRAKVGTQAKLYLIDPILGWIPHILRAGSPSPDFTALTEQAIGVAVARSIDRLEPGRWIGGDTIGYERTGSGNEIDLASINVMSPAGPRPTVPIESKWVDHGWRREALTIEAKHGTGILATKTILDLDHNAWAIPAPLLAMLLG
jgi:uncharacterized protein